MAKSCATCGSGKAPCHFDVPGARYHFCSQQCKEKWINKHLVCKYEINKLFITHMEVFIVPDEKKDLADPNTKPNIVVKAWALKLDATCNKGVRRETLKLKFDYDNKKLIDKNGNTPDFENGKEMVNEVLEALANNV